MGLSDREYYRDENEPSGFTLRGQPMVVNLIIINVAVFLADIFIAGREHWLTMDYLAIRGDTLVKPWLWYQFLTCGFAHSPMNSWHLIGNMLGLWIFGRPVEEMYGPKEFLRIYLAALLFGSVSWCLIQFLLVGPVTDSVSGDPFWPQMLGASGAVTAVIMLFVFHFPRQTILLFFVIPMPAWVFGVIIIAGNLFAIDGPGVAYEVHLAGALFAACYYRLGWNLGGLIPGHGSWAAPRFRSPPALKVHEPDEDSSYEADDEEADRLLEKVGRLGIDSLTAKERRILEDYSRRMQQKHR